MTVLRATKKPVTIETILFDGLNVEEICNWMGVDPAHVGSITLPFGLPRESFKIPTLEGDMTATKGDFIIKGVEGEFYPCKPDIFYKTYDINPV